MPAKNPRISAVLDIGLWNGFVQRPRERCIPEVDIRSLRVNTRSPVGVAPICDETLHPVSIPTSKLLVLSHYE